MQRKRGYYFKPSANYLLATKEFNHLGDRLDIFEERVVYKNTSFRDLNVHAYLEYGILDRLTLIGSVPIKAMTSKRTEIIGGGASAREKGLDFLRKDRELFGT